MVFHSKIQIEILYEGLFQVLLGWWPRHAYSDLFMLIVRLNKNILISKVAFKWDRTTY